MERFWREYHFVFEKFGGASAGGGKAISIATRHLRRDHLIRELHRLRTGKLVYEESGQLIAAPPYKLKSVYNLQRKHVQALANDWTARRLSIAYVHNLLSMLRTFCTWIGKPELVGSIQDLTVDTKYHRRSLVAMHDATWSGCGLDPSEKIAQIAEEDSRAAIVLELMLAFALRMKEACLLRPWLADQSTYLDVNRGTKGGRARTVPINDAGREVLDRAKALVERNASLVPRGRTYVSYRNHIYYVLRCHGISIKESGTSSHGLRHERLNREYHEITGTKSPIKGGQPGEVDCEMDRFARQQVAETAGHCRPQIASIYLGGVQRTKSPS